MKKLNKNLPLFLALALVISSTNLFARLHASETSCNEVINIVSESDSQKLQNLIDAIPSTGGSITLPEGTYTIHEVLKINNRQNITLNLSKNTVLKTNKHGHGILEIANSKNIIVNGGVFSGAGNFLDKNYKGGIGGGEKLYTLSQNVNYGYHKNSSLKALTKFNGGYLGNCGIGILISDGSVNISILNTEIKGFNYSGIQIQFLGDSAKIQQNYCENIRIEGNDIHDVYSMGVSGHGFKNSTITNNRIRNIGHPDTDGTEDQINPGYGIAMSSATVENTSANNIMMSFNIIFDCKRVGIDAHSGTNLIIDKNTIDNAFIAGVSITGKTGNQSNVIISNNIITNCGTVPGGGTFDAKTAIRNNYPNTLIENNTIVNSGYSYGIYSASSNTEIINNSINYTENTNNPTTKGICILGSETRVLKDNLIKDNYIEGAIGSAIYTRYLIKSKVIKNTAKRNNSNAVFTFNNSRVRNRRNISR
jgi:hypothetical protein